jgi:hypothetical protein
VAQNKSDAARERVVSALERERCPDARQLVEAILEAKDKGEAALALLSLATSDKTKQLIWGALRDLGLEPPGADVPLATFKSPRPPRLAEPYLDPVYWREPPRPGAALDFAPSFGDAAHQHASSIERQQGVYLPASGTLMQLNAIVAGILGALLLSTGERVLKVVVAGALSLHVLAAFALCWAARPVGGRGQYATHDVATTVVDTYADGTFRGYRRGWRLTLLALATSSMVAGLFVLQAFGIAMPDIKLGGSSAHWIGGLVSPRADQEPPGGR